MQAINHQLPSNFTDSFVLVINVYLPDTEDAFLDGFDYGYVYLMTETEFTVLDIFQVNGNWLRDNIYQIVCYFDDDLDYLGDCKDTHFMSKDSTTLAFTEDIQRIAKTTGVRAETNLDYDGYEGKPDVDYVNKIQLIEVKRIGYPIEHTGIPVTVNLDL